MSYMIKNKKVTYLAIGIVTALAIFGILFALHSDQILRAIGYTKTAPVFTFDAAKAPNWWAGDNYNTRDSVESEGHEEDESIDRMPVASMTVLKGKQSEYTTSCFVMLSYYDYSVDVAQLEKETADGYATNGTAKNIGKNTVSMTVLGETKEVALTKYELVGVDSENAMKGMSYGWIDMGDSYVSVSGVCPSGSELDDTLAAVNAVSLIRQ